MDSRDLRISTLLSGDDQSMNSAGAFGVNAMIFRFGLCRIKLSIESFNPVSGARSSNITTGKVYTSVVER